MESMFIRIRVLFPKTLDGFLLNFMLNIFTVLSLFHIGLKQFLINIKVKFNFVNFLRTC
jgi:hypothetical protein